MKKKWVVIGVIAIVLICVIYTIIMYSVFRGVNGDSDRGTFGDMFGALNTFFSALAFGGLIYTIILQRSDLRLQMEVQEDQIKELALQREEAKRSGDTLAEQKQLMNLQRVESTVFQILRSLEETAHSLTSMDGYKGNFFGQLDFIMKDYRSNDDQKVAADEFYYGLFDDRYSWLAEKYFKTILYMVKYIHDVEIHDENKQVFADLLKINLGEAEIELLYVYLELTSMREKSQHYRALLKRYGIE